MGLPSHLGLLTVFLTLVQCQTMEPMVLHPQCLSAPTMKHRISCEKLMNWGKMAKEAEVKMKTDPRLKAKGRLLAGKREPQELGDCMDLACVARFLTGNPSVKPPYMYKGKEIKKLVRKEVRMLTDAEWKRLVDALEELKKNGVYDEISLVHMTVTESCNAHSGPAFFPWHREYIKRMELELRRVDPDIFVPYWDQTLDAGLPKNSDTIIFSAERFGNGVGPVTTGPWGRWITDNNTAINRMVGENGDPFNEVMLTKFWNNTSIEKVLAQTGGPELVTRGCKIEMDWDWFELLHGNAHNWIGGDMLTTYYATRDPSFYMHHSFVDLIWEKWRLEHQTREQREKDWPKDKSCMLTLHWPTQTLIPFNKRNIEGLSNAYTDNLYEFAPRPSCTREKKDCGSRFLFCDLRKAPRCTSKARIGGNCTGFTQGEDVCYGGVCLNGKCVDTKTAAAAPQTQKVQARPTAQQPAGQETCFDNHPCCQRVAANGNCANEQQARLCAATCRLCTPTSYTITNDCVDRSINCPGWARMGECQIRVQWMATNCRASCNLCGKPCATGLPQQAPAPGGRQGRKKG